jgi:8-amino-7-oxononanoate synthase
VAGSKRSIEYLTNRSPTWIYTTGLSPADTAAALTAIEIIQNDSHLREGLWANIRLLQQALAPLQPLATASSIFCIPCQNAAAAIALSQKLFDRGIFAPAIRPPTVPTSRIRLTVTAAHSRSDLDYLITHLTELVING